MRSLFLLATTMFLMSLCLSKAYAAEKCATPKGAPIKIGLISSYSGPAAVFSTPGKNGLEFAAHEINCKGGLLGRPITFVVKDDKFSPEESAKALNDVFLNDKVNFLAGCLHPGTCVTMSNFAKDKKILFFPEFAQVDNIIWKNGHKFIARFTNSARLYAGALATEAAKLPAKKWVTISPNDDYGKEVQSGFVSVLKKLRPDVKIVKELWPQITDTDFSSMITSIQPLKADAVFSGLWGATEIAFAKQASSFGLWKKTTVVSATMGTQEELAVLGKDAPNGGLVFAFPWDDPKFIEKFPDVKEWSVRFKEFTKADPNFGARYGYESLLGLAKAVELAKSVDSEKVVEQLQKGISVKTPWGEYALRGCDQQSAPTIPLGSIVINGEKASLKDYKYIASKDFAPTCEEVKEMRKNVN